MITRPMLAGKVTDINKIKYPVLTSIKIDGVRLLRLHNGRIVTRTFKPLPNRYINSILEKHMPLGIDGELVVMDKSGKILPFNNIQSQVMSEDGEPNFHYYAFDYVEKDLSEPFNKRYERLFEFVGLSNIRVVNQLMTNSSRELIQKEESALDCGHEGLMIRSLDGPYKCGRSTEKEGYLLKLKRFNDADAEVVGYEERMHNENEKTEDEFGLARRSSHKANQVGTNTLGAIMVKDLETGMEFKIGTGFNEKDRIQLWKSREGLIGKFITYKYQPSGVKEKPRFPVFLRFRDKRDVINGY